MNFENKLTKTFFINSKQIEKRKDFFIFVNKRSKFFKNYLSGEFVQNVQKIFVPIFF